MLAVFSTQAREMWPNSHSESFSGLTSSFIGSDCNCRGNIDWNRLTLCEFVDIFPLGRYDPYEE
jgi:hypothetical protein